MLKNNCYLNVHNYCRVTYFNLPPAAFILRFLPGEFPFCGGFLKSVICVAFVNKAAGETRKRFFKPSGAKKISSLTN